MTSGTLTPAGPRLASGRVLVIDDSAFFRGLLVEMLKTDAHEVLDAAGAEGLAELLEGDDPPDLILLDLGLPDGRGRRILRQIRDKFGPEELPVLALTEAVANDADLERLNQLGCAGAVNKLAPPDHVRFRVRSALFPPEAEERGRRRVALSLGVRYRIVGEPHFARTHTLSPGGVFVRSNDPPPLGAEVELRLELGDPNSLLKVGGAVVRREEHGDGRSLRGFAVHFTKITTADRAALAEFLERIHDTGL